jgi:two-component system cell cycle sensor histidine kinase/response regulator CckA
VESWVRGFEQRLMTSTRRAQPSLLIVEDEALVAADLGQLLAQLGFTVVGVAATGDEALRLAADKRPDLALMDIRISGAIDGVETAELLRSRFDIPVVYLTAHGDSATIDRAKLSRPYGYLLKPFKSSELRTAIEIALLRHALEVQLRERERLLATTMRSIGDGVVTTDAEGLVTFVNPVAEQMTGWSMREALGRGAASILHLVDEDDGSNVPDPVHEVLRNQGIASVTTAALIARDGSRHAVGTTAAAVMDEDRICGAVVVLRDMTVQRQMERQVEVADRMAALGAMAAGVAHEIDAPMTDVLANLELALHTLPGHAQDVRDALGAAAGARLAKIHNALEQARLAAMRTAKTVADLGTFARKGERKLRTVDVRRPLDWALHVTDAALREAAQIVLDLGPTPPVLAEEMPLGQVFANLLLNAAQSIAPGATGEIRVSTRTDERGDAVIEFRDTGCGMAPALLRRIFEPFFTTHQGGPGAGLGLFTCHGVIRSLGGEIRVESEPGQGSTFAVHLPRVAAAARRGDAEVRATGVPERIRVLAIDDEPAVRRELQRTLSGDHAVTAVASAREALSLIRGGERYEAIFCDLMMPEMSGMEFYGVLRTQCPDQAARVIFLSGGAFTTRAAEFLRGVANEAVEKPFEPTAVRQAVAHVMAHPHHEL